MKALPCPTPPFTRPHRPGWLAMVTMGLLGFYSPLTAAATPEPVDSEVTTLPPFIVEDKTAPLRWQYLSTPGFEVLSVCDDPVTRKFVERCLRLEQLLATVLPKKFQATSAVPDKLILFDEKITRARSREVMEEMMRRSGGKMPEPEERSIGPWEYSRPSSPWPKQTTRILPNLRLRDADTTVIFASLVNSRASAMDFTYQADRISDWLENRSPALPDWFVEGMMGLYQQAALRSDQVEFGRASWLSENETQALAMNPDQPRTLLPMQELLTNAWHGKAGPGGELQQVWRAQCALFVRWALAENGGVRKEALWTLVDRLEREPLTETLLQECFGLGFSDVRDRLSDYLPVAVTHSRISSVNNLVSPPVPDTREATPVEIARICGDWERLEINYIKGSSPHWTEKYVDQARRRVASLYDGGIRDPELVTVRALIEIDAGNATATRPDLESVVAAGVVRPRAYLELALLRYQEVLSQAGVETFQPAQTAIILEPVWIGCRQEPALPEFFGLMVTVWSKSKEPPTPEELARLAAGLRRSPKMSRLMAQGIVLHLQAGLNASAIELARLGWLRAQDPKARDAFERLLRECHATTGLPINNPVNQPAAP